MIRNIDKDYHLIVWKLHVVPGESEIIQMARAFLQMAHLFVFTRQVHGRVHLRSASRLDESWIISAFSFVANLIRTLLLWFGYRTSSYLLVVVAQNIVGG